MTPATAERDLLERVHDDLGGRGADAPVVRTAVGERLVAVALGDGPAMGVAHRPPGAVPAPVPTSAEALSAWAFEPPDDDPVAAALGVAALNARSSGTVGWRIGDPMASLSADVDRIATVGLFRAALRKFDGVDVRVIEREPVGAVDAPAGVSVAVYGHDEAAAAIDGVDVLFVTGSSLVYGGTTDYLRAAADVPTVVVIGATASFRPDPVLDAGATLVAGARVTDPDRVWAGIEAGQCGTDLHGRGLEKVYVADDGDPPGIDFATGGDRP